MEKLIKQKENLENEITKHKEKYSKLQKDDKEIQKNLENLKTSRLFLVENFEKAKNSLKDKKLYFIKLKTKVKEFKMQKNNEIREIYFSKYKNILKSISEINWRCNLQIFKSFDSLKDIQNESEIFTNLNCKIIELQGLQKNSLKNYLKSEVVSNTEIHNMIYLIKFIKEYEIYFNDQLFVECINSMLKQRYEYHFLSNNETNRLDKAEWIFNFFEKKIKEIKKYFEIYGKNNMSDIFKNIVNLIKFRINELEKVESIQKRNILINFNFFLTLFIKNIKNDFSINLENEFLEFKKNLIEQEKEVFLMKLQNIHKMCYTEWFTKYEEIIKENIDLIKKLLNCNIEFVVDNILEYNLVFIDSMRYINRKEIQVLVFLFNKFEDFKENIQFLLEECLQENNNCINEDDIDNLLLKTTNFNLDNFKLLKTLLENDVMNIINLRFYFVSDLQLIFEDYKKCKAFNKLKYLASDLIDKHLSNILLDKRLDKNEYLDFLNLFRKLKNIFDIKKWNSRDVMKCIKGIFENKNIESKFKAHITELYN